MGFGISLVLGLRTRIQDPCFDVVFRTPTVLISAPIPRCAMVAGRWSAVAGLFLLAWQGSTDATAREWPDDNALKYLGLIPWILIWLG